MMKYDLMLVFDIEKTKTILVFPLFKTGPAYMYVDYQTNA